MSAARFPSPHFTRLLQLAGTLLVVVYMVFIGGSFDAVVRFRVQLLTTVAGGALALAWLIARSRQRRPVLRTGLEWPLLALAASQWLSTLAAPQPRLSVETAASVTAWALVFLVLCDLLAQGWPRAFVLNALLLVALVVTGQTLLGVAAWAWQWLRVGQLPPLILRSAFRPYTALGNPNLIAICLNLLLPLWIARLLCARGWPARLAWAIGLLGLLGASIVTGSRSGWMVLGVVFILMPVLCLGRRPAWLEAWLKRWRGWSRPGQYGALALIILVAGTGMVAASVPLWNYLLQGRAEYWRPAWLMFLASPLTGGGPGQHLEFQLRIDSIPPLDFFPHGHSLMVETLGSSGLTGGLSTLAVVGAGLYGLWRRWRQAPDRVWLAALISGLAGACLHQLTDHFLGTPSFAFLFVLVSALALAPSREDEPPTLALKAAAPQATYHPAWLGLPIALVLGITIFALRGAGWNARGVELANQQDWATAAQAFRQAAMSDPALALYWENAAQASTRAGAVDQAIPLWAHAARLEPRWAIDAASLAALTKDAGQMEAALNLAPQSYLIALNVGVLREAQGDLAAAQVSYRRALEAAPNALVAEALFWRQTPARETALAAWQASRPKDQSLMGQGWAAYQAGDFERAREILAQYLQASPFSVPGHARLGRTELALGDLDRAEACLETGRNLQSITPLDGLELEMLRGDLAAARGDSRLAQEADLWIFSIISEYTATGGPGTYGNANRAWWLFHREGLPGDLIPQLMRADVTADIDKRLARLAQGYAAEGLPGNACFVLAHPYHEAPVSESGRLHEQLCPAATRP